MKPEDANRNAWHRARFGLMIHWGLYSLPAGEWKGQTMNYVGEWIMSRFRIPMTEYEALAKDFDPIGFDADEWCRIAKRAGMGYMIFTAKHHDGFAMYHSQCDAYNVVDATPFKRDPVAELAAACQRHDLLFGLYYSQSLDWHERHAGGTEPGIPLNHEEMHWGNDWDFPDHSAKDFRLYLEKKAKPQIVELLSNYGPISHLWFDCPLTITAEQSSELYDLAKSLQPGILINSRLGNDLGDFQSLGDNLIPGMTLSPGWETAATLNDTWGYKKQDVHWKTSSEILEILTALAGRGINYLLNVGPDESGRIPTGGATVLHEVGQWMAVNFKSISDVAPTPYLADPPSGPVTCDKNHLYFFIHQWPAGNLLHLGGILNEVKEVRILGENSDLPFDRLVLADGPPAIVVTLPPRRPGLPVVMVATKGPPAVFPGLFQQAGGHITLPASAALIHQEPEARTTSRSSATDRFAPDGTSVSRTASMHLSTLGSTANWWKTEDYLSWDFMVCEPGHYQISIITTGLFHDLPCQEGHQVLIDLDGQHLTAVLKITEHIHTVATRYYLHVSSNCGILSILVPGNHTLILKAVEIQPGPAGLSVVAVNLDRAEKKSEAEEIATHVK